MSRVSLYCLAAPCSDSSGISPYPASILRNDQCLEIFLDCAILFFGGGLIVAHFAGRKTKREENWPHPPVVSARP